MSTQNKRCLICQPRNDTLYFHQDPETKDIWLYCNKCQRGYSLQHYCHLAGISLSEFLKGDFDFQESAPNEVRAMVWPKTFVPLSDPRAQPGVDYVKSRGLTLDGDIYYDLEQEGIVFPMYFSSHYVGGQVRFIKPRVQEDGDEWKITTVEGTRLGLLFGLWNQDKFITDVKAVVVCEGYFNALSLQQAFNLRYGGVANNPWKFVCLSGSGLTDHQAETLKELRDNGYKVIAAGDTDEAGYKLMNKLLNKQCITHFAFTDDETKDWNDFLREMGHKELAAYFLSRVRLASGLK